MENMENAPRSTGYDVESNYHYCKKLKFIVRKTGSRVYV